MRFTSIALLGALAALAAVPAVATADPTTAIKPVYKNNKAGAGSVVDFGVVVTPQVGDEYPPPGSHAKIHLPKGQKVDFKPFLKQTCTKETILTRGPQACPKKSKVGSGFAHIGTRLGGQHVYEKATVDAYAGPLQGGKPVLNMYADGRSPISAQIVLQGVLKKDRAPYGDYLDVDIPPIHTTPGSPDASILDFNVTVGAHVVVKEKVKGKLVNVTKNLITVPTICSGEGLAWAGDFGFTDGSTSSSTAFTPCPKGAKR